MIDIDNIMRNAQKFREELEAQQRAFPVQPSGYAVEGEPDPETFQIIMTMIANWPDLHGAPATPEQIKQFHATMTAISGAEMVGDLSFYLPIN